MFFDTHAHYDSDAFDGDRDAVLTGLAAKGVDLVVCPADCMVSARACVALAERYPFIHAAVGVHPHEAQGVAQGWLEELETLSHHAKAVAIGEIGLDYHYDYSPREVQQTVFRAQMALAEEVGLPVVVHDREAHRDCLDIVREFPKVTGVYHCYSGGLEDAKILVGMGWYLSFTGAITFKNARKALEVIAWMPEDRIMIETDSPYLTPEPFRGRRNDSGYVYRVAETIAQVRGITTEATAALTRTNGLRFFNIEEGGT